MQTATKRKPREKKPKQSYIEGTEPPSIPAIDAAAEHYVSVRDERCELSKQESEAHDNLLDKMREHGLDKYEFDGHVVTCLSTTKAAVKKKKTESDDRADAEE